MGLGAVFLLASWALAAPESPKPTVVWNKVPHNFLPFYYEHKGPNESFTWAFPPGILWEDKADLKRRWVLPFYFRHESPESKWTFLPELLYYHRISGSNESTWAALFYSSRSGDSELSTILPALWWWRSPERSGFLAGPVMYESGPSLSRLALVPIGWFSRNGDDATYALAPLFWYGRRGPTELLLFPAGFGYGDERSRYGFVGPWIWWNDQKRDAWFRALAPVAWAWKGEDAAGAVVLPLGVAWRNGEESAWVAPLILTAGWKSKGSAGHIAGPWIHWRGQHAGGDFVLPLVLHSYEGSAHQLIALPVLFADWNDSGYNWFLLPVAGTGEDRSEGRNVSWWWAMPVLHHQTPAAARTTIIPLATWNVTDRGDWSVLALVPPLGLSKTGKDWSATALLPYLHAEAEGDRRSFTWFPLVFSSWNVLSGDSKGLVGLYYWSRKKDESRHVLFPLWWDGADRTSSYWTLFPLLWHERTPDSELLASPVAWAQWKGPRLNRWMAGPLYWSGADDEILWTLFPLLWRYEGKDVTRTALFPLFYRGASTDGNDSITWVLPPLFMHSRFGGDGTLSEALLLAWLYRKGDETFATIFPALWWHSDSGGSSFTLLPLAYVSNRGGRTVRWIGPWIDRTEERTGENFQVLFPVFWRFADPGKSSKGALFPVYWWSDDEREESHFQALLPFFLRHSDKNVEGLWIFPLLFGSHSDAEEGKGWWWAGPFVHGYGPETSDTWVLPISRLYFGKQRSFGFVGPAFWDSGEGYSRGGVFPLAWWDHTGDERRFLLLPLAGFRSDPDSSRFLTWGFGFSREDKGASGWTWLGPIVHTFAPEESDTWILPLGHVARLRDRSYGFLTVAGWDVSPNRFRAALFPLFWVDHSAEATEVAAVPLFLARSDRTSSGFLTWGFGFGREDSGARGWTWAGPVVQTFAPEESDTWVFPLGHFERWKERRNGFLALAGWDVAPGRFRAALAPLLWFDRSGEETQAAVLPLFVARSGKNRREFLTWGIGFGRDDDGGRGWTWLGPLVHTFRPDASDTVLIPLAHFARRGVNRHGFFTLAGWDLGPGRTRTALFPLLWYAREADEKKTLVLPLFASRSGADSSAFLTWGFGFERLDGGKNGWTWAGPVVHTFAGDRSDTWVVPVGHFARDGDRRYGVFALAGWDLSPQRTRWSLAPLAWHESGPEGSQTVVFPLFGYRRWRGESGFASPLFGFYEKRNGADLEEQTVVSPLYVSRRDRSGAWRLAPLWYSSESADAKTGMWTLFPLAWSFRDSGSETATVLPPLYWQWKRPASSGSLLFPVYLRYVSKDSEWTVIPPMRWTKLDKDADGMPGMTVFSFEPFYEHVTYRNPEGELFLFLHGFLGGYQRQGVQRRLILFRFFSVELSDLAPAPEEKAASL